MVCTVSLAGCGRGDAGGDAVRRGDELLSQKRYRDAAQAYRDALDADPADESLRAKLGQALAGAGDTVRAADLLAQDLDVQLNASTTMLAQGRFSDVVVRLDEILRAHPANVPALVLHANAVARLRDSASALFILADKVGRTRRFAAARVDLRPRVTSADDDKAEAELTKAMELAPSALEPRIARANLYWATSRLDDAEPLLRGVADEQPGHAAVNHALGAYYLDRGRDPEAVVYLAHAAAVAGPLGRGARFTLADYYIRANQHAEARALLDAAVGNDDEEGEVSVRLAELDGVSGDTAAAVRRLDAVLRRRPTKASALLLKARLLFARGNPDPTFAREAVAADPGAGETHMLLGDVLAALGDVEGSLAEYREAVRRDPTELAPRTALVQALLRIGNATEAVQIARDAVRLAPAAKAAALALVAANLAAGRYEDATAALAPVLVRFPGDAGVATSEGRVLAARGNSAAARAAFLRALAAEPDSIDALSGLVEVDANGRPAPDTERRVEAALAARPGSADMLRVASRLFSSLGDRARAEALLRRAFVLEPSSVPTGLALAELLKAAGRLEEGITVLRQVLANRPPRATDLRARLASYLEASGKNDEAREQHEQIVLENPDAAESSYWLGVRYLEDPDRLNRALELAMAAKRGRPDDPDVSLLLGRIYTLKGLTGLAVTSLQDAVAARPGNAVYRFHLAAAYERGGNLSQARAEYARALQLDPSFPGAEKARQMAGERR